MLYEVSDNEVPTSMTKNKEFKIDHNTKQCFK